MSESSKDNAVQLSDDRAHSEVTLGRYTSYDYVTDPKHFAMVASRYKFCAQMLRGCGAVVEVGCGDGFGSAIIASTVERLLCIDVVPDLIRENRARFDYLEHVTYECRDLLEAPLEGPFDGAVLVDVLEHILKEEERVFLDHLVAGLAPHGVLIVGTPNVTAAQYASEYSRRVHVNLKSFDELRRTCEDYFHRVFMFGMNDEVVHTGWPAMCHYLWAVCTGRR